MQRTTTTTTTEDCSCGKEHSGPCDRCHEGIVTKPVLCEVDGHIQFKDGRPRIACDKCTNEGWKYDNSVGRWHNTHPENEAWIETERRQAIRGICEWYEGKSTEEFIEYMFGMIEFCKKMGFY
jgi:hypothetical protein